MTDYIPYDQRRDCAVSELLGRTLLNVEKDGDEAITFKSSDGRTFIMYHWQDCCESVYIEDVCGDLSDLVGAPVTTAEESTSGQRPSDLPPPDYEEESQTWTFYRIGTAKGMVTIRWYGSSNGYYSESVDFIEKLENTNER